MEKGNERDIEEIYRDKQAKRSRHEQRTEEYRNEVSNEIASLRAERLRLRNLASCHAGNLGLVYDVKTNQFFRVIISDLLPVDSHSIFESSLKTLSELADSIGKFEDHLVSEFKGNPPSEVEFEVGEGMQDSNELSRLSLIRDDVDTPAQLPGDAIQLGDVKIAKSDVQVGQYVGRPIKPEIPDKPARIASTDTVKHTLVSAILACIPWLIAACVGCFVGYGLMMVAGFLNRKSPPSITLVGMGLGIAVIFGLKILLEKVWFECTRDQELGVHNRFTRTMWTVASAILILSESYLGARAIVKYSEAVSFSSSEIIPLWGAMLMACTISSASLIYSAVHGASKAKRSIGRSEIEQLNYNERIKTEALRLEQQHKQYEEDLQIWKETEFANRKLEELRRGEIIDEFTRKRELESAIHSQRMAIIEKQGELVTQHHQRSLDASDQVGDLTATAILEKEKRLKEFEHFRLEPDFQALCQCIALIDICSAEIEERRQNMTNETIRRGYLRSNAELL